MYSFLLESCGRDDWREDGGKEMQPNLDLRQMRVEVERLRWVGSVSFEVVEEVRHHVMLAIGPLRHVMHIQSPKLRERVQQLRQQLKGYDYRP